MILFLPEAKDSGTKTTTWQDHDEGDQNRKYHA